MPLPLAAISAAAELARFAGPRIARWVAGDAGEDVAERTVAAVTETAQALTGNTDPAEALEDLQASRELQARFEIEMARREAELERAYLQDRQHARARDVALQQAGAGNLRADVLAVIAILGLVGLAWALVVWPLPEGPGRDMLLMLAGALISIVRDVYGFEFGSSRGSKQKDALLGGGGPRA